MEHVVPNIQYVGDTKDLFKLSGCVQDLLQFNTQLIQSVKSDLIDVEILEEIKNITTYENTAVYFGKTLRDIKIVIEDEELRKHEMYLEYKVPKKLIITNLKLPSSIKLNREYSCIKDIIEAVKQNVYDLARYFYELENIDQVCCIMEPVNGSFKDDFRRIFLDDRTWLHVEVTPEGLATNIHLIGQSEHWHNKLQSGLLNWDHDKSIVDNIMTILDLFQFPQPTFKHGAPLGMDTGDATENAIVCGICLCTELPDSPGVPQPLCQNISCGVYYHRTCLYQWLVACSGSRPPAFGVANGSCPTCLQSITCSEKDN
ncbi:hypothetical protein HF086_016241 [Spodoptera exigua]|uniref:E3 ubiquitin-protein ligase FANCL n=1 Tax=Spodoptera exigua TaxID=7107 RepID=A0A922SHD5_SPOEX|nr:hypothetical protein HF086_016241 [Spodoptera exigua]